ncbi:Transcription factor bHLH36 [Spatholobus suberectus]|nr:Transcription factor bHLH36 [Spatholobus suberectus]
MAHHQQGGQPSSTKGIERRIVEKNRRNHMKDLCSKLNSLLPNNNPRGEALSRADQIDEATNYIKNLETKVKMAQEKKESLMQRKRSRSDCSTTSEAPKIEIREMGSSLQIILTCGFDNQFMFSEVIRILHEENIEVKSAHSSLAGNSMLHVGHAEIQQSFQPGTTAMTERLKRFVDGHRENF